jgi:hypothetical protein
LISSENARCQPAGPRTGRRRYVERTIGSNEMIDTIDDDERTNAVGLFNTARSYWRSAEYLAAAQVKVTHPQAPITFLFCHAIELYLKAFLRSRRQTITDLKKIGHRVTGLSDAAFKEGLKIPPEQAAILQHLDEDDVAIESRYIVTGFKQLPTNEGFSALAEALDKTICSAMAKQGFAVRLESFKKPVRRDEVVETVEDYIPFMTTKDKKIIAYLLHHNQRMFTCEPDGGHARLLLSKGIVCIAARPGQQVSYNDVPFEVPVPVWKVLLEHRDKFPFEDDDGAHPWRVGWMER